MKVWLVETKCWVQDMPKTLGTWHWEWLPAHNGSVHESRALALAAKRKLDLLTKHNRVKSYVRED